MGTWKGFRSGDWTFGRGRVTGHGGGIGEFRASYAVDITSNSLLNGRVSVNLRFANRARSGGGLICRANDSWTCVAFYVAPATDSADSTVARIGVFQEGILRPVAALGEPVRLSAGYNRFVLEFYSGQIRGEISGDGGTYELITACPHVPFPGYPGLVKFYGTTMIAKDFSVQPTDIPFIPPPSQSDDPFIYDVFLCHSGKDAERVRAVADLLKTKGVTYWLDAEQITFGDPITLKIEDGLRQSRYLVPCVSENLSISGWTRAEYGSILNAELSGDTQRVVVPLVLDEIEAGSMPILLRDKKRVSYSNRVEFDQFVRFLLRR